MTVNLLTSIEQLVQRKADLLREADEIDRELERVRLALNGHAPQPRTAPVKRNYRRDIRVAGSIPNDIYGALEVREPRSIKDLSAHLKVSAQVVQSYCRGMVQTGHLHRVRLHDMGRTYVYSRTAETFAPMPQSSPKESDDELGQRSPSNVTTGADTTSQDKVTSHA